MPGFEFDSKRYPDAPGCYLMKGTSGRVIYVGKAKRLRRRLGSYFQKRDLPWRTRRMVGDVAGIDVILVSNETEALVLENNLIKHYRPRYNRQLMAEDSGYFYIAVTDEALPRLAPYRKRRVNKQMGRAGTDRRLGPYPSRRFRDTLLDYVNDSSRLRTCDPLPQRACYRYHLGHCTAVCEDQVSADDYCRDVARAVTFLSQPNPALLAAMREEVEASAARLEFERAQRIGEQARALEETLQPQIVERDVDHDQCVIIFGADCGLAMCIRNGAVLLLEDLTLDPGVSRAEACTQALAALVGRQDADRGPAELIVDEEAGEIALALERDPLVSRGLVPAEGSPEAALLALCEMNLRYREGQRERR